MFRILLVEDDPEISGVLERQLTAWNYQVGLIRDVLGDFRTFQPHLVLLDIGLPYRNGYHWCEEIRKISKVPILFLSSASDNLNIIMAVNLGRRRLPGQALRPECAPGQGSGSAAPGLRLRRAGACPGVPGSHSGSGGSRPSVRGPAAVPDQK